MGAKFTHVKIDAISIKIIPRNWKRTFMWFGSWLWFFFNYYSQWCKVFVCSKRRSRVFVIKKRGDEILKPVSVRQNEVLCRCVCFKKWREIFARKRGLVYPSKMTPLLIHRSRIGIPMFSHPLIHLSCVYSFSPSKWTFITFSIFIPGLTAVLSFRFYLSSHQVSCT